MKKIQLYLIFFIVISTSKQNLYAQNQSADSTYFVETDYYTQGQKDAEKYYKKDLRAGLGTFVAGIFSPIIGLVPAIVTSATTQKAKNLGIPNEKLFKNNTYYAGYSKKAKRMKQKTVWISWAATVGVYVFINLVTRKKV